MKKARKLTLNRETLRTLDNLRLEGVAGGGTLAGVCTSYNARCTGSGSGDTVTCLECSAGCATGGACSIGC
ncbi:MAG TPA: class I lanthipeptide [Thermoanaerobaculia bacterium]|jgi:hypothetical protein